MILSRRRAGTTTHDAAWDGPFAPPPSMGPARFDPTIKTAGELVAGSRPEPARLTEPAAAAPAAA